MSTVREILERHAERGQKLSLENVVPDRKDSPDEELIENSYTLIKGSPQSLRFLGELLIEFADGDYGCAFDNPSAGSWSCSLQCGDNAGDLPPERAMSRIMHNSLHTSDCDDAD